MAGGPNVRVRSQLRFKPLYHSLQAAIDGVGVAMGPSALVAADVEAGRLVPLFPERRLAMAAFHVMIVPGRDAGHGRRAFRSCERVGAQAD